MDSSLGTIDRKPLRCVRYRT